MHAKGTLWKKSYTDLEQPLKIDMNANHLDDYLQLIQLWHLNWPPLPHPFQFQSLLQPSEEAKCAANGKQQYLAPCESLPPWKKQKGNRETPSATTLSLPDNTNIKFECISSRLTLLRSFCACNNYSFNTNNNY
jgi:hypothetical protein